MFRPDLIAMDANRILLTNGPSAPGQTRDDKTVIAGADPVTPGFVETDMAAEYLSGPHGQKIKQQNPLGRLARPEEVARVALFLVSEDSDFLTGAIVDVNGALYLRS